MSIIVKKKSGTLLAFAGDKRPIDLLPLEWYETGKRILHKRTAGGRELVLKLLNETAPLLQDDVVYADPHCIVAIDIVPCQVLVIRPENMYQMASVVYEIGNKHLPLFYEDDTLLVPFEKPLFHLLTAAGFAPEQAERKLLHPLKTSVAPHGHDSGGTSLFSRIMKLTAGTNE